MFQTLLDWSFIVRETDEPATLASLLADTPAVDPDLDLHGCAYLIRRANPEHDAEDTQ